MAVLSTKTRKNMSPGKFALSGRRFPVEDDTHARMALSGASRALHVGNITPEEAAKVRHRAHAVLGESDSTYST